MNNWDDNEAIKDMKEAVNHFERRMRVAVAREDSFSEMVQSLKEARGWLDGARQCLEDGVKNVDRAHACHNMARKIERVLLTAEANHEN